MSAKEKELKLIREANQAAAVGRLMLGDMNTWEEFLFAEAQIHSSLTRRQWRSGAKDVKRRLSKEVQKFCNENFKDMSSSGLSVLYEEIKAQRHLEMPVQEFELKYAKVNPKVLSGNPAHSTIVISLWGMQFKAPEDHISRDLIQAICLLYEAESGLREYEARPHEELRPSREVVSGLVSKSSFAARTVILLCSVLVEAFLNGLAWKFRQNENNLETLSGKRKKLIFDGSLREKVTKYPEIIAGRCLGPDAKKRASAFLDDVKPYRDAMMHLSPAYGEDVHEDKLARFYAIGPKTAYQSASTTMLLLADLLSHCADAEYVPAWFSELKAVTMEKGLWDDQEE